jgi:phosphoribosylaminoimidazole carboxylase PurE protein
MVACLTPLPVIGVPVVVNELGGLDALLSIAQMPKGIPVATVAIDNAYNAGLLAVRMISIQNPQLTERLLHFQKKQKFKVKSMNQKIKKLN